MPDLIVLVPSRGRPEHAAALADVFADSCTADTLLTFCLDADDPTALMYSVSLHDRNAAIISSDTHTMVEALNEAAVIEAGAAFAVGFMGDDHRPRTAGWDACYLEALHGLGTGIVYGDDLLQGSNLPTQCAMTSDIVRTLGYMAPPALTHLYVDNFWLALGRGVGCIKYLPDVVIEHVHPLAQKLPMEQWSEGHLRVNAPQMYAHDQLEWSRYRTAELPAAVDKVKALRA